VENAEPDHRDHLHEIPRRVLPLVTLLTGVMAALQRLRNRRPWRGSCSVSGRFDLRLWRAKDLAPILTATLRESTMPMFIVGMSPLYSYVMSCLHISQSTAQWIVSLE
jgi:C4-dicarboxylate transporter DctM subunit